MSLNINEGHISFSWYKMDAVHFSDVHVTNHASLATPKTISTPTSRKHQIHRTSIIINAFYYETEKLKILPIKCTTLNKGSSQLLMWDGHTANEREWVHKTLINSAVSQNHAWKQSLPVFPYWLCIIPKWQFMSITRVIQIKLV